MKKPALNILDDIDALAENINDKPAFDNTYDIDIDSLDEESKTKAQEALDAVSRLYASPEFLLTHSFLKKRIDLELDTLRGLIKMRESDSVAHDALLSAISQDKSNSGLYRSLAEIQKMFGALSTQIADVLDKITNLIKDYQEQHIDKQQMITEDTRTETVVSRGTKELIKQLQNT